VLPNAGVSVLIRVDGGVSIKTGVLYQQKGWHTHSSIVDTDQYRTEFYGTVKLHELTLPLQLQYAHGLGHSLTYSIAAGVSYDFTLQAEHDLTIESYKGEELRGSQSASWNPYIGLIPDDSRLKSSFDGTAYYLFNPSMRLEAGIQWKKRYGAQIYWEHSINSVNATYGSTTPIKIGYLGISVGVCLAP
jgi:predicted porin